MIEFQIPTDKTPVLINPNRLLLCIYGQPGIGKTTFAAGFPDSIFFDLDRGSEAVSVRHFPMVITDEFARQCQRQKIPPTRWSLFQRGLHYVIEKKAAQTIVIDTIDAAYQLAFDHYCFVHKVESPEDDLRASMRIWGRINAAVARLIHRCRDHAGSVVFLSQEQRVDRDESGAICSAFNPGKGRIVSRYEPALHKGKPRQTMQEVCSIVGRAQFSQAGARVLHCQTNDHELCKDRTGVMPAQIDFTYQAFLGAFRAAAKQGVGSVRKDDPSQADS